MKIRLLLTAVFLAGAASVSAASAADWPQFMRTSEHAGDAADEELKLPLGLVTQVKLDDASMTSPAVVGGLAYVVDQMGTAYCIEPKAGRIVWKSSPDGGKAMGSNTSSPCVTKGRMYYGTTAGTFHVLDCKDGQVVKTVAVGWPVISSPTFASDRIYFQALDAVVRCLDLDGNEKWNWDHYKRCGRKVDEALMTKERLALLAPDGRHYGGGDVTVSGSRVVTSIGWDVFCLEDKGKDPELAWCNRVPWCRRQPAPMSSSISGEWVYTVGLGNDGERCMIRLALKDGIPDKEPLNGEPFHWITPAVRGATVANRRGGSIHMYDCDARRVVAAVPDTPVISSHTLSRDHLLITTLSGELVIADITAKGGAGPLRLRTPHGKGIASAPVVSGGCVFFGCDDGYFYVYGPGGALQPRKDRTLAVHARKGQAPPATGKTYGWISTRGNVANTSFVDDPELKPPLTLRWVVRDYGHFKVPCAATAEGDLFSVTLDRMVTCFEQATGRMRWRLDLMPAGEKWPSSGGMLADGGRLYVPVPSRGAPKDGRLVCLDIADGRTLWSAPIGTKFIWNRGCPLPAGGRVVYSHVKNGSPPVAVVSAWEAETGKPAWELPLDVNPGGHSVGAVGSDADGCADGDTVYFTGGAGAWNWKPEGGHQRGEILAIDAKSGKVLWRSSEVFGTSRAYPVLIGDKLLLQETGVGLRCVSAKDGAVIWKGGGKTLTRHSVGPDYIAARDKEGLLSRFSLATGKAERIKGGQLAPDGHACGSVALTPNYCFSVTVVGLAVSDTTAGKLLWQSPGFAPRACIGVALANGRAFWPSAVSGMIFCAEPKGEK